MVLGSRVRPAGWVNHLNFSNLDMGPRIGLSIASEGASKRLPLECALAHRFICGVRSLDHRLAHRT